MVPTSETMEDVVHNEISNEVHYAIVYHIVYNVNAYHVLHCFIVTTDAVVHYDTIDDVVHYDTIDPRFSTFFHDRPPPRPSTNSLTPVRWTPFYQTLEFQISKSIGKDVINPLGSLH